MSNNENISQLLVKYERLYDRLMRPAPAKRPVSQDELDQLDYYIDELLSGVDLEQVHADFFNQIQTNYLLFSAFVDLLKEAEENARLITPPSPPKFSPEFLKRREPVLVRAAKLAHSWSLAVDVGRQQVEALLNNPKHTGRTLGTVMRSGGMMQLDPQRIKFIDKLIELDGLSLHLSLGGVLDTHELTLELRLFINELNGQALPADLVADLRWGGIHFQAPIQQMEQVRFPIVHLRDIVSSEHKILHGMQLSIVQIADQIGQ